MLLSNSFILSCYLNYLFVTFGSFLNSCCNVEYVFYSRKRILKKLMVEEICNKSSAYSYTLKIRIFRLFIVETIFLAVNKGSFERNPLCAIARFFFLIGCYIFISEVISFFTISERILARWLVDSYGLWVYRPWKWRNMSRRASWIVFGFS